MMHVVFDKEILMSAIQPAMSAVSTKSTSTAAEGIKITAQKDGDCIINSFDMDKGIICRIKGDVEIEGSYIINGQKLSQMIRNMPGSITIDVNEKCQAKITSENSRFTVSALPGDEFPNMPALEGDWGFVIEEWQLKDMLNKTLHAVAVSDPRPALNGIFFQIQNNQMTMVSSDSFRLAIAQKKTTVKNLTEGELNQKVIVPAKTATELMKMIGDTTDEITVLATRKHIIFKKENLCFFSRLIDAEYIEYRKFLSKNITSTVTLKKEEFLESLERASLVTEDRSLGQAKSYVKCSFDGNVLSVSSDSTSSSIYDQITMQNSCEKMEIGFHCRYLLDALRAADTEYINISLVSPLSPILIEPVKSEEEEKEKEEKEKKADFIFLVVPIRMKE